MQGRQLPFALLATVAVVVAPALFVAALPGSPGPLVGIPLCVVLSLGFARVAAALWRRSPRSREVLFADLMLWGWVRRLVTERRLASAESLLTEAGAAEADRRLRALERVSAMLESRDAYTRRHSLRVTRYSEAIARGLELDDAEVARIRQAAALHDVGKFFTPRAILNKPGRLTDEEFDIVKRHPGQGAEMLHGVVEPKVEAMIRHHHERLGGNGYPDRLTGDAIPLGARIIAVADTFDAMTSTRAYRSARPHAVALKVLREEAGVALDAQVVTAFARARAPVSRSDGPPRPNVPAGAPRPQPRTRSPREGRCLPPAPPRPRSRLRPRRPMRTASRRPPRRPRRTLTR